MGGKVSKSEKILLGLTALFLCLLLGLSARDRTLNSQPGVRVETESAVPEDALVAELSLVNLNTASAQELTQLPGIGEELARRIVEYRERHGAFASVEELLEVSGIGEGKLAAIVNRVSVEGDETQ